MILLSGDAEINPGPRHDSGYSFSICHWNLNSLSAYNYTKSSLKTFAAVHKFDISCLSEAYLDSSIAPDDDNLEISVHILVRSNHPSTISTGEFAYTIITSCHCEFKMISNNNNNNNNNNNT